MFGALDVCVVFIVIFYFFFFFFFNDTATTEIYTLSLHDALPISGVLKFAADFLNPVANVVEPSFHLFGADLDRFARDRKSTRLNSSHSQISYAVFCLKKKTKTTKPKNL